MSGSEASGATVMTSLLMISDTDRLSRSGYVDTAIATSRSVTMPIGWPPSTTGTAPHWASRKIMVASSMVLKAEQVRGLGVITSAAVSGRGVSSGIVEISETVVC